MRGDATHAVVVGAGIVGIACAHALAREGFRVTIVDGRIVAGGATAAGMGHVVVMDDSPAQFALTHWSQQLWHELARTLPDYAEYRQAGTLWVAADDEEMLEVHRKAEFYTSHNVDVEVLDSPRLAQAEPHLRPGLAGALLVPGDCVVYPPTAARWLLDGVLQRGGELRLGTPVSRIDGRSVTLADGTRIDADLVVNAAANDSASLTEGLDIRSRKGHLVITDRYPDFVRHQLVELGYLKSAHSFETDSVAFNAQPRATGQILIGSSRQFGSHSGEIDHAILSRMLRRALQYMPDLGRLSIIRAWTGFRAATPDKLPLIGPSPTQEGVYLATGHEGLGITTSLGTAELLVSLIVGRRPPIDPQPYLPTRFATEVAHAG